MAKYRIDYKLMGLGNFFVEAPSVELAFEKLYESFETDNSLIVHAKFPYGFEIERGVDHAGDFPKKPKARVTTSEELEDAKDRDTLDPDEVKPPKFADTALFDFDAGAEPEQS
jgi:hypothetical protein